MSAAFEIPPILQDAGLEITVETVHSAMFGACCCTGCIVREMGALQPQTEGAQAAAAQAPPTSAEILNALQFQLTLLDDDTLNTASDPAYNFTYQFATTSAPADLPTSTVFEGWRAFTSAEKAAVRAAMDHYESILNVTFTEVTGELDPDMNVGLVTIPGTTAGFGGYSYSATTTTTTNHDTGEESSVTTMATYDNFILLDETVDLATGQNLILHELGHALGLKHPFDAPMLAESFETNKWTVMSYQSNPDTGLRADTLQLFDIFALQDRWGGNMDTADGGDRYTGPRNATTDTIWDAGGRSDWLDAKGYATDVTLNLNAGEWSQFGSYEDVIIAYGVQIEHARGGNGDDTITGNDQGNKLYGGAGDDTMYGGGGKDRMIGNNGADMMYGGDKADDLNGGKGNDWLFGENQRDYLFGSNGRDRLDGGQADDLLEGGRGNDTFYFRSGGDEDTIIDFENDRDRVLFEIDGITTRAQAAQFAQQDGDDVVYDFGGGDVLRILNMTVADMADDFNVI